MPGVPSNKACQRCKKRHLKCDETRPSCQRCTAAGIECPGYVQTRKFIDQGATVRRRYAPYAEPQSKSNHTPPVTDSDKTTRNNNNVPDQRPGPAQQVLKLDFPRPEPVLGNAIVARSPQDRDESAIQSPIQPPPATGNLVQAAVAVTAGFRRTAGPIQQTGASGQEGQDLRNASPAAVYEERSGSTRSTLQSPAPPSDPVEDYSMQVRTTYGALVNQRPPYPRLTSSENLSQKSEKEEFLDIFSELMTGSEHEIAFFLRHFAEVLGPWLDLSDSGKFFSAYVPIRAINSLSLKYAVAALASKHLGRVKGAKSSAGGGMFTSPATTETYPNASRVDWFLKAANYYYLAISSMQSSASTETYGSLPSSAFLGSPIEIVNQLMRLHTMSGVDEAAGASFARKIEDLIATTAILYIYKLLDANEVESRSHLAGIRSLFDTLMQLKTAGQLGPPFFLHGTRAAFWNFARQDYLSSYMNRSPTHLDPDNLPLWRAAGLPIDEQGNIRPNSEAVKAGTGLTREDLAANTLIWLITKVINFLAQYRESQMAQWTTPSSSSDSPLPASSASGPGLYPTTSTWLKICFEFQTWFEDLPETFRPCIRIEHPNDVSKGPEVGHLPFPEIFYSQTSCAATMQQYHFARIALLLNRPPDAVSAPSSAFDRLQGYREVAKEVEYRSREICGIALGRPQGAVRIHTVPLLFAVGQCLERPEERQIILDILRGVEADLGWATDYAIKKLQVWIQ